jgi:PIN domain nuclease of toxin-antitoxin system
MTTLLLDTHAYVWAVSEPDRLSASARVAIAARANRLLVSAATVWEMAIKHRAGRWPEAEPLLAGHADIVERLGGEHLDIGWADARRAGTLRWAHADPFDRMLAAQAVAAGAALVTRDAVFEDVTGLELLW